MVLDLVRLLMQCRLEQITRSNMKIPEEYLIYIVTSLCILFGSVAHTLAQLKHARANEDVTFTWTDSFILLVLCVFSGGFTGVLASLYFADIRIIILAASMGSFVGIAGMDRAAIVFRDLGESWLRSVLNTKQKDD